MSTAVDRCKSPPYVWTRLYFLTLKVGIHITATAPVPSWYAVCSVSFKWLFFIAVARQTNGHVGEGSVLVYRPLKGSRALLLFSRDQDTKSKLPIFQKTKKWTVLIALKLTTPVFLPWTSSESLGILEMISPIAKSASQNSQLK